MTKKRKNCKICDNDSGGRNVCVKCKTDFPYVASKRVKGVIVMPFDRKKLKEKIK